MNPKQNELEQQENELEQKENEPAVEDIKPLDVKHIPESALREVENTEEKQKLVFTIQKYQDSLQFGKIVKYELGFKQSFTELSELSELDLENILYRIRRHLDNKHLDKFYENMASTIAITYEQAMSLIYPIDGFSDMLLESEDFWNCYERYRIEMEFPSVNPLTQMCFMVAQFTLIAHHMPSNGEQEDYQMEEPMSAEQVLATIEEKPEIEKQEVKPITEKQEVKPVIEIKPIKLGEFL